MMMRNHRRSRDDDERCRDLPRNGAATMPGGRADDESAEEEGEAPPGTDAGRGGGGAGTAKKSIGGRRRGGTRSSGCEHQVVTRRCDPADGGRCMLPHEVYVIFIRQLDAMRCWMRSHHASPHKIQYGTKCLMSR